MASASSLSSRALPPLQKSVLAKRQRGRGRPSRLIVGSKWGRLVILELLPEGRVLAECQCGVLKIAQRRHVVNRRTRSCGCLLKYEKNIVHGWSKTRTYKSWTSMKVRCNNPKRPNYRYYGGRGIKVCKRWDKFENFLADMGERPEGTTLDRINGNGNYEPRNCRWADAKTQARNRLNNRFLEMDGTRKTVAEWAESIGVSGQTIIERIVTNWPLRLALTLGPLKSIGANLREEWQINQKHKP